jgi:hypothetical protein
MGLQTKDEVRALALYLEKAWDLVTGLIPRIRASDLTDERCVRRRQKHFNLTHGPRGCDLRMECDERNVTGVPLSRMMYPDTDFSLNTFEWLVCM